MVAVAPPDPSPPALEALVKDGEARFRGPNGEPRLVALGPLKPGAPAMVFVHGIGGDPANQEILIRQAQRRGYQVYVMAYDSFGKGGSENAPGFARAFRALADGGTREVTIVAHSLGALTTKAALSCQDGAAGFTHVRYFALAAPWGGVNVADLSLHLLQGQAGLAFARDLAPSSPYWRGLTSTALPSQVEFYNVQSTIDQFHALCWGDDHARALAAVLATSRRTVTLPGGTHNSAMWDPRAAAFIFDPQGAPDPATRPGPGLFNALLREVSASAGQREPFRPRPGEL